MTAKINEEELSKVVLTKFEELEDYANPKSDCALLKACFAFVDMFSPLKDEDQSMPLSEALEKVAYQERSAFSPRPALLRSVDRGSSLSRGPIYRRVAVWEHRAFLLVAL